MMSTLEIVLPALVEKLDARDLPTAPANHGIADLLLSGQCVLLMVVD